ncbi:MAG TPA: zf-HC2 domain-containing protein, partial [Anaerolineales bacterium]|nr:zf-HC2 domain-containing protein [Anaerolineales bacterium]
MTNHTHQNCQALLGSLSEYIDGELPPDLCKEIEKHLEGCDNCRIVLNTTRRTIDLVQIPAEENVPDDVRE